MKPLSPLDAGFLFIERSNMPMHVGGLHLYSYPDGADDQWLQSLLAGQGPDAKVTAPFNQKLRWPLSRLGAPHWETDRDIDLDYHVRHSALPKPGRYREMFALISRLHSTPLHRDRPLWEAHVIEGVENKRFALYTKMHHAMVDGMASMRLLRASLSENPDDRDMPHPWAMPPRQSSRSEPPLASPRLIKALATNLQTQLGAIPGASKAIGQYLQALRPAASRPLVPPFQAPRTVFNGRTSAARRFVAQSYSITRIKAIAKALDATLNDIVLAMSAGALRSYLIQHAELPAKPLTAMAPVSIRPADGPQLGNAVTALLTSLATNEADPVKRLKKIQKSMGAGKALLSSLSQAEIMMLSGLGFAPAMLPMVLGFADKMKPAFNLTISNVPGPKNPLYWNGARLEGMYPVSIPVDGAVLNITVTSYVDSLDFGIIACRRSVPSAQRLIDYLEDALKELEVGCR